MSLRALSRFPTVLALTLLLAACGGATSDTADALAGSNLGPPGETMSDTELAWAMEVLDLTNRERILNNLPTLAWHDEAAQVGFEHAVDMRVRNFFDHTNPDGIGPSTRLSNAGVAWWSMGENIARGQDTPQQVVDAWMNSTGHRANILNSNYTHLGVGVHIGPPQGPWWVQVFLRPPGGSGN